MKLAFPTLFSDGIAGRLAPGDGETVFWIHGYTLDATIWSELWSRLPGWNHIGIDLPGHGESTPCDPCESFPKFAQRLVDLALRHNARHVVGLSFGGTVALQMAIQSPWAFSSLVLGSPGIGCGPVDRQAQTRKRQLSQCFRERGPGPWMTELWMTSPPNIFKGASRHPRLWELLRSVIDRHSWLELQGMTLQQWHQHPQQESEIRKITCPTLILLGEDDMPAFKRSGELLCRWIPTCQRVYLPHAGHTALLEAASSVSALMDAMFCNASRRTTWPRQFAVDCSGHWMRTPF